MLAGLKGSCLRPVGGVEDYDLLCPEIDERRRVLLSLAGIAANDQSSACDLAVAAITRGEARQPD